MGKRDPQEETASPGPLLRADGLSVRARDLEAPVALFSIDVETDFGTGRTEALSKIDRLLDLADELALPLTAFVEGGFFRDRPELCRLLAERLVDVQLHCWDHSTPGDTPELLRRSVAAYSDFLGRAPEGYRAHTYRLTRPLYEALVEAGFKWDSSLMRAWGQGRNGDPAFAGGDYLVLDGRLVEFPVGRWRRPPIPFNHTHRLLVRRPGELLLRAAGGPGRLVAYNCHMTDLVRCGSLASARRSLPVRALYRYMWSLRGGDTFPVLRRVVTYLRRRGYELLTTSGLYRRVAPAAGL